MKKNTLVHIATLGPLGYLKASGTIATIVTLPLVYFLSQCGLMTYVLVMIAIILVALISTQRALRCFRRDHDPSEVVIDEVVGCLITFCARETTRSGIFLGFILFRIFDIFKPLGIRKLEIFKGAWGITLDDVLAGIISNIILWIVGF